MTRSGLVITNHSDDIEILARIHLVISLTLSCLMDYTLANIGQ